MTTINEYCQVKNYNAYLTVTFNCIVLTLVRLAHDKCSTCKSVKLINMHNTNTAQYAKINDVHLKPKILHVQLKQQ